MIERLTVLAGGLIFSVGAGMLAPAVGVMASGVVVAAWALFLWERR